jgi:hypothetical protein
MTAVIATRRSGSFHIVLSKRNRAWLGETSAKDPDIFFRIRPIGLIRKNKKYKKTDRNIIFCYRFTIIFCAAAQKIVMIKKKPPLECLVPSGVGLSEAQARRARSSTLERTEDWLLSRSADTAGRRIGAAVSVFPSFQRRGLPVLN